jgi:acyl-CoA thioester hydrolase
MVFSTPVTVRGYELDTQGHLNQAVYLQYSEHARWELLRAAGIPQDKLIASGIGPVVLEATITYLRELRGGDKVDVTCAFDWSGGKTFKLVQHIIKEDGAVAAEISLVGGILDLTARRLVADPAARLAALADDPALLGR